MSLNIRYKLSLAFLLTTAITVGGMFVFFQWSFSHGFLAYMRAQELRDVEDLAQALEDFYVHKGSWQSLEGNSHEWLNLHRQTILRQLGQLPPPPPPGRPGRPPRGMGADVDRPGMLPPSGDRLGPRLSLLDNEKRLVIGRPASADKLLYQPILVEGKTMGYLTINPPASLSNNYEQGFIQQQSRTFALISIVTFVLALGIALPLAWQLVRPIRRLAEATHRLTSGDYRSRIDIERSDELGQLSADFNRLAATLEANEHARSRWMADISHELRTPLAVLKGQIEALQDGVRTASPKNLDILHDKIHQLNRLINDLYELSLSDVGTLRYSKAEIPLGPLLNNAVNDFLSAFEQKNIALVLTNKLAADNLIYADEARLQQLFGNLLTNSLRYTDSGGQLRISARTEEQTIIITFEDSVPGVTSGDIPHLFDRLYRTDSSRSRETGGAGLGLSICQNIVKAHEGSISATSSPLGGLKISIFLPLTQRIKW
ncbi:ATP-binding protein [Microbulbifer sp. GL-2]|uniref:ATP-binding protein n=1 Tax=Microbulbifer sp. GL-2 TaxID=2591606 RepID=UPI001164F8AA|nr:ATP-binding protein [Microbulbifer sp. GL-2]BBM00666.1 two-component sensor histidine kinase [Microbulbifer sp. GL-2]